MMFIRLPLLLLFIILGAFQGIQGIGPVGALIGALIATVLYLFITGVVEIGRLFFTTDYAALLQRLGLRRARDDPEAPDQ